MCRISCNSTPKGAAGGQRRPRSGGGVGGRGVLRAVRRKESTQGSMSEVYILPLECEMWMRDGTRAPTLRT